MAMSFSKQPYGKMGSQPVDLYTLSIPGGLTAKITNYGGIITELWVPDRYGTMGDVVLGYDRLQDYIACQNYLGCLVGRYANRIANGQFELDGVSYQLARNDGENHLHGGVVGFNKKIWQAEPFETPDGLGLRLQSISPDGEEGYPGNLTVSVVYMLTTNKEWRIDYTATSDKPTVCNLTQHSYFNLKGYGQGDILDHRLMINADYYTPVDVSLTPTGDIAPVADTPLDFRHPMPIGQRIHDEFVQLRYGHGYDHNWVLNKKSANELSLAAEVYEPTSGRKMRLWTTEPAVQFYTGNFLDGSSCGKGGKPLTYRSGLCLETQHYPDSPNKPHFPSTTLRPGQTYRSTTIYQFTTD